MKPIRKFNNGDGALLCNICRTIMLTGDEAFKSGEILCEECTKNLGMKKLKVMCDKECRVEWCSKETEFYNKSQRYKYCSTHIQYKKYAINAPCRPWLMYKVEKILNIELECESCGYAAHKFFPDRPTNQLAGLYDVDHINSELKTTPEGEQPSNYQLLCKQCHILKSYDEGDFIPKNNR